MVTSSGIVWMVVLFTIVRKKFHFFWITKFCCLSPRIFWHQALTSDKLCSRFTAPLFHVLAFSLSLFQMFFYKFLLFQLLSRQMLWQPESGAAAASKNHRVVLHLLRLSVSESDGNSRENNFSFSFWELIFHFLFSSQNMWLNDFHSPVLLSKNKV